MDAADQLEYGFATAIFVMEHVAEKLSAEEAERSFNETSKENFWRLWPAVRTWGETLWRTLEEERAEAARPVDDEELDDVTGGG